MKSIDRRAFLQAGLALGCSAAASPLITPLRLAAAPGDKRLVVIILRGGMDGLGVFAPQGERAWAALRRGVGGRLIDLDDRF
ncbi:MAG: twin-arginine translocation pathway signal, partial [Paracoccaceae bacterium]